MIRGIAPLMLLLVFAAPRARPGWLGLGFTAHRNDREQWLVVRIVIPGGPAEQAGLRVDDVITRIDGKPLAFRDNVDLLEYLGRIAPRQRVTFTISSRGRSTTREVVAIEMTDAYYERWRLNLDLARRAGRERMSLTPRP